MGTHVSLVASQACYPLHHQDSSCWQHSELTRCIWIAVSFFPGGPIIFLIRVYRVFHRPVTHWVSVAVSVSELVMWLAFMDNSWADIIFILSKYDFYLEQYVVRPLYLIGSPWIRQLLPASGEDSGTNEIYFYALNVWLPHYSPILRFKSCSVFILLLENFHKVA